ncbi:MAG TPA: hypothetical protein DIC23_01835 [Planctomycetaceae bacterium]|nr:hypothetical protein [Planctomycetaceae bacterium]
MAGGAEPNCFLAIAGGRTARDRSLDWCHEFDKPLMLFFFVSGASPWFSRNHFSASRTIQLVLADGCSHTTVEPVVEFNFCQVESILMPHRTCVPLTHRVRLHFRSLSLTRVSFNQILASTKLVYGQYGIDIVCASGESLQLSPADAAKFQTINGTCTWTITSGEYAELQRTGTPAPSNDVVVYFVDQFSQAINGCGGHLANRPACVVARAGTQWCTAHEVCHVLLGSSFSPVHMPSTSNLMHSVDIQRTVPTLTSAQVTRIKQSPLCRAI